MRKSAHMANISSSGKAATLYRTMHTKRLSGMRKMFMMVARTSSGMYFARMRIMLGQKTPTHTSKRQKATICTSPMRLMPGPLPVNPACAFGSGGVLNGLRITGTASVPADTTKTICMYDSMGGIPGKLMRRSAIELPPMEASMNVAKMNPCGMFSPCGDSAGVHRKTNVYMDASNMDWIAPRRATFLSFLIASMALRNCTANEEFSPPPSDAP
mmetsp:Transcript_10665/g.27063  ORF Transcript_10665/g.27063 Transcript_10665/m.27063 type:complete len:214 (-) Transcript_10665:720-1361(-)